MRLHALVATADFSANCLGAWLGRPALRAIFIYFFPPGDDQRCVTIPVVSELFGTMPACAHAVCDDARSPTELPLRLKLKVE